MKRCPQCGQRTTNLQLEECPYCRVKLVTEIGSPGMGLTREQAGIVVKHLLGSWKLWAVILLLVGAAAWGVVEVSQKVIDARTKEYLSELEGRASNRLATASAQISKQVSNQIESEFKTPRIQSAIEQVAKDRVNEALTNSIWPSLDAFKQSIDWANRQLALSSNDMARLDKDIKALQRKAAQAQVPQAAPATLAQTNPPRAASPAVISVPAAPTTPSNGAGKLVLANQAVSQNGPNYILTMFFQQASSSIGTVSLVAGTYQQTAKIINFGLVSQSQVQPQPMVLNDTGDAAQFSFNVAAGDTPVVAMELTGPTIVRVTSDSLAQDLTLGVAAEKLVGLRR